MKKFFSTMLCACLGGTALAQVSIHNGSGTDPDAQSMLDVQSTTKGALLPRMTMAQRDAIGATASSDFGMLIYQTDNTPGYYYWTGSAWTRLRSGTTVPWTDITGAPAYLTTEVDPTWASGGNHTNAINRSGDVGINVSPSEKLHVNGNIRAEGTVMWGNSQTRTETRDNAGLQGNAGARSGFFETSVPAPGANWYAGASSWQHLIDVRHSNSANNYAMQIAGSFFDQDFYVRKTNNNAAQAWSRLLTSAAGGGGTTNYLARWISAGSLGIGATFDNGTNVSIGTTAVDQKLNIGGNGGIGFVGTGLNASDKKLYSPADGDLEWVTHNGAGAHGFAVSHQGSKMVYLNTSGNSYFQGGNLGIGTTGPAYRLEVNGNAFVNSGLYTQGVASTLYGANASIYANQNNAAGGGIMISDDGGFVEYNDGPVTFVGSTGLRIAGSSGAASSNAWLRVNGLAGTGNRQVYADPNGTLTVSNGNSNSSWVMSANMNFSPDDFGTGSIFGDNTDDARYVHVLPFSMTIEGVAYDRITICSNGWVAFGDVASTAYYATSLPSAITTNPILFPFWTDFYDYGGGEYIVVRNDGTAPNRVVHVRFRMRARSGTAMVAEFQVQIHEGSGLINVKYNAMHPSLNGQDWGYPVTIGFQLHGGASAKAFPITHNSKVLDDNAGNTEGFSVCPVK